MVASNVDWLSAPHAAQRAPNWRHQQAGADALNGRFRLPAEADVSLRALTDCLQSLRAAENESQRSALLRLPHCRDFRIPLELFENREMGCRIESLVLAGQCDSKIAKQVKLDVNAVALYITLFFDVRELVCNPHYVVSSAIQPEASVGIPDTARRRVAMKAAAYFCGPQALNDYFFW